ncbi:MAG: OB-fold nucleic acid binding domain-containing protein [Pirellulales bacterium]
MFHSGFKRPLAMAILAAGIGGGLILTNGFSAPADLTAPPSETRTDSSPNEEPMKTKGTVADLHTNKHGDIDGLSLKNGNEVKFPPHQGVALKKLISVGDEVTIEGRRHETPKGDIHLHADRITTASGKTLERDEPGKRGPGPKDEERPMSARGTIVDFHVNRPGDVDGFELKDGTEVKFPPHQGVALKQLLSKGDEVRVEGRRHVTPKGDVHLHADTITTTDGRTLERDEPRDRRPSPDRAGPKVAEPPHEQILRELRDLRRLIEEGK